MIKKVFILLFVFSFISCGNKFTEKEKAEYTVKGKEIAQATFKKLSGELMAQMKAGGPVKAIPFCNLEAVPLVDELSKEYNAIIKRTSDQLRSCDNEPTERELVIINEYQELLQAKQPIVPIVELDEEGKKHFYAPIKISAKCLVCHGEKGNTLANKTDSIVKSLYPNDLAIGYKDGDLRGIWSITFNE
jgi:hypothetical protein